MYQYPWIWLNVFANGWTNCSDYSRSLNMHAYLICLTGFEDVSISESRFLNWHGCIYKIYPEFWICLIIAPYASITTVYTQICVNVPEYSWTWLNIPKYPWIYECPWVCLNKQTVLIMPWFWICRNVVITTLLLLQLKLLD